MFSSFIEFSKSLYPNKNFIPLHEPTFIGNEKKYVADCLDSTFVSSVGVYVTKFEEMVAEFTQANYAVATMNGTAALHIALLLAGIKNNDEVITQPLTFVATVNAIRYCNAAPVFLDVSKKNMGLCPDKLADFLANKAIMKEDGFCYNKLTNKRIKACLPMHTFGHPCEIEQINSICQKYNISLIEDSAESIGSYYKAKHTGTFGELGIISFNGNKTITCGGGGMIITNNKTLAKKAKHLTTTAKKTHPWEYDHDHVAYNYRLTNLSAALGCAQMEFLSKSLESKRKTAEAYAAFFENTELTFFKEPEHCQSNYWLNAILLRSKKERDQFLEQTNAANVMTRPIWNLMNTIEHFKTYQTENIENALFFADRVVNIPSSYRETI